MTEIYLTGRYGINFSVNVFKDDVVFCYGALLSREKIIEYQTNKENYEVRICDITIQL